MPMHADKKAVLLLAAVGICCAAMFFPVSAAEADGSAPDGASEAADNEFKLRAPIFTGVNPEKRDYYEKLGQEADEFLADKSFTEHWRKPGVLETPEQAEKALEACDERLSEIDRAVKNKSAACYYTFLVNRCINLARETSFDRKREIEAIKTRARTIQHKVRVQESEKRRAERLAEPFDIAPKTVKPAPEPSVTLKPKEVKPASMPGEYKLKEVKEPSKPAGWEAKKVQEPSKPSGFKAAEPKPASLPSGAVMPGEENAKGTAAEKAGSAPTREELERANQEALAKKQAEATERQRQAEKKAAERKAKREARNRRFQEDQAKRRDAQLKYEEEQKKGKSSGLLDFF